jgi:mono/diheme cytochrome c family protein
MSFPRKISHRPCLAWLFIAAVATGLGAEQPADAVQSRQPNIATFESTIKPILAKHCVDCHGADVTEGNVRVDTLDPDLVTGKDTDWWLELFAVLSKGEMPPPDSAEMSDDDRRQVVEWLSTELETASIVRRGSGSHSTFRRLTRYEYNHALQDLLGLPWDFAKDLPPESASEHGFENSAELLHLSVSQFETYHKIARTALARATVRGERPETRYWAVTMKEAAAREWPGQAAQIDKAKKEFADNPEKQLAEIERLEKSFLQPHGTAYFKELSTGRTAQARWDYGGAKYAFASTDTAPVMPGSSDCVAILPATSQHRLIIELGNQLPDEGTMRVTVRAARATLASENIPSMQLLFGFQASNEGRALLRVSDQDTPVTARPDEPQLIEWDVPLGEIYPRNSVRKTSPMGAIPSPSEYIRLANSSASPADIQVDYVQVAAPVYDTWPPPSHQRIFFASEHSGDEQAYARDILSRFMTRAWRRPISKDEVARKLDLLATMRPQCDSFETAVVEVLATVLSSPHFLFVAKDTAHDTASISTSQPLASQPRDRALLNAHALATRLALFLWSSVPDDELLALAENGQLTAPDVLASQVDSMLADPRSARFSEHFVHQWLNLGLLEFLNLKQHVGGFDPLLKEALQHEPAALFGEILSENASVLDFVHCDYAMLNERLARHYGIDGVQGNHFRRVPLDGNFRRGGLLTQAGLLTMNSDWPDSHPLKRAIWLLERVLNDPPPPPPPAVPQIDLADPRIAEMTLKERIEDHRNHAACISCHAKIDPWGIAFENYDALGRWRDKIQGKPIDASSELFNHERLDGMEGLKRFLLEHRQDAFVHAMVHKLTTYALGRPLTFADHSDIDAIASRVRREGDGLKTIIRTIATSDLFRSS